MVMKKELIDKSGIYIIKNKINGKIYIGKSYRMNQRLKEHVRNLRKGTSSKLLQKDFDRYGEESFKFEILEEVPDKYKLLEKEDFYIDKYDSIKNGYNVRYAIPRGRNDAATVLNDRVYGLLKNDCDNKGITVSSWLRKAVLEKLERDGLI